MTQNRPYTTRDIFLASTLITLGYPTVGIDFQYEGNRGRAVGYFQFEDTPDLNKTVHDYWGSKLAVEPREFITNFQGLKSQINEYYKNPNYYFNKEENKDVDK